jgi:hypothetical protein
MMETKTNSGQTATGAPKNKVAGKVSMLDGSAHSVNRV